MLRSAAHIVRSVHRWGGRCVISARYNEVKIIVWASNFIAFHVNHGIFFDTLAYKTIIFNIFVKFVNRYAGNEPSLMKFFFVSFLIERCKEQITWKNEKMRETATKKERKTHLTCRVYFVSVMRSRRNFMICLSVFAKRDYLNVVLVQIWSSLNCATMKLSVDEKK